MRPEKLYLTDLVEAADAIQRFIIGITPDDFLNDELRQSAVLQKLIVIGEAAARLSPDFQARFSHIEWNRIVGLRNIVVHAYFSINFTIVWETATQDAPLLRRQVLQILRDEFT